jgi:excinuclease ABC subunit C
MKITSSESYLSDIIKNLPQKPGVYQFYDNHGNLLYIGKARDLKKRVASYFNKISYENNKIRLMVNKIADLQHIVVSTESDALLLENNLIKKYQPKYNVNLKDDKSFPWICIKNERFPRVFSTRTLIEDGSKYYGPYTSALTVKTLISLIRQLYNLRTCKYNLSEENITKGKFKVCLEYHIGNCKGPCESLQSEDEYLSNIRQIQQILKGNLREVIDYLSGMMNRFAGEFKYEEAEKIRIKIEMLEKFQIRSTVVNPSIHNVDVFSILDRNSNAYVNYIKIVNGAVIQSHSLQIRKKLEETKEEILEYAVAEIRNRMQSNAKELIVPFRLAVLPPGTSQTVPVKGDKKRLMELSERNAKYYMLESEKQKYQQAPEKSAIRILTALKKDLRMTELPIHIECFDNSNIQGADPVAACVVFRKAKPSRNEYRHYNVKSVKSPDDYASMEEIVSRRYARLIKEAIDLPQLIIIDGGKGQLNAAVKSLAKLNVRGKITVIGIAKRLEEIYFPEDPVPLYMDKNSESLKLIQQLRNEAHRFGVKFHRQKRSGSMLRSEIKNLHGFGDKTIQKLWIQFESLDEMKKASENEIAKIIGNSRAKILFEYLKSLG